MKGWGRTIEKERENGRKKEKKNEIKKEEEH